MKGSKFSELYLKLSKVEKIDFLDFSTLKRFNLSTIDKQAVVILTENLNFKSQENFDVFLYGKLSDFDSSIDKKAFEYVKNHLLMVLISFLKWQLTEQNIECDLSLLAFCEQKKAKRNFESTVKSIEKSITQKKQYYTDEFQKMQFSEILLMNRESRTRENIEIEAANIALDKSFIINKLRLYCKVVNECNLRNRPVPEGILTPLNTMDYKQYLDEDVLILIYHSMAEMLENEQNPETYHLMFALVRQYENQIEAEIVVELYAYLRNRCSYYCNSGMIGFAAHFVELIRYLEEKRILIFNNEISLSLFKNTISAALVNEDFDWASNFAKQYSTFINRKEKYGIELFHRADLKYHQGDLEATLEFLSQIEKQGYNFKDQFYHISYNKLFIKIYLMKNIHIGLYSKIDAFAKYIYTNKKIRKQGKIASLAFVSIAKKIYKKEQINLAEYQEKLTVVDFQWLEKLTST